MDKSKITISNMTLSDLNELNEILQKDFDDFWSFEIFKEELTNNNSSYLVLRYDNEIVCLGGFKKILDEADIMNIVTKKNKRNLGFAKLVINELINLAKKMNCKTVTLEVSQNNNAAIHLYKSFNFYSTGIRHKYYTNSGNAAILMTLDL